MLICAVDPGLNGAFVFLFDIYHMEKCEMPIDNKEPNFEMIFDLLSGVSKNMGGLDHIFLERAMPMAMGARHAFNYGRGFAAIEIAIKLAKFPVTYVEPAKWMKVMHEGTDSRLKPKERSKIALERLAPKLYELVPKGKTGKPHDGILDAALLGLYGLQKLKLL